MADGLPHDERTFLAGHAAAAAANASAINSTAALRGNGTAVYEQPDPEEIQHAVMAFYLVVSAALLCCGCSPCSGSRWAVQLGIPAHAPTVEAPAPTVGTHPSPPASCLTAPSAFCLTAPSAHPPSAAAVCHVHSTRRAGALAEAAQAQVRLGACAADVPSQHIVQCRRPSKYR